MSGLICFIVYTAIAAASVFVPAGRGWFFFAALFMSMTLMVVKVWGAYRFYRYIKIDDIHHYNLGDILDLPEFHVKTVDVLTYIFFPVFFVSLFLYSSGHSLAAILTICFAASAVNFIYPIIRFAVRRASLYISLRKKGCSLSVGFFRMLTSGVNTILYFTVTSPVKTYRVGLLGAIGETRYMFEGGRITRQRVNPILREYSLEVERTETPFWQHVYLGAKHTYPLTTDDGAELLIIPDNVFVMENGRLLSIGDRVLGSMNITDIMRAPNYISTMYASDAVGAE